jgi:acyl transferase domain-containing protein
MHRLALVTAYEALEMAGYSPNRTPSTNPKRVGTFYGQASDDWREVNAGQNIGTYGVPGGERAFANGRINYFFKFGGPSFNIDTACSSGLAAVQAACSSLWLGESDMVLAGGLNIITNPDNYSMLCNGHFLSKTGQCKVWDKTADGYCRADGIGSVVIKRLEDAEVDNDNIIVVISAAATNHSAESPSITQPHAGAQMENYQQVLQSAGVSPLEVSYVELHGTGTQVGDAVESESVASVFSPLTPLMRRQSDQPLHLGAVKSSIGHGEAAAGIASLIKALLAFQKGQIPPQVPFSTGINPAVEKNISRRNMSLVMKPTSWPKPHNGSKRYALVNSFGAHGGNTTLLLEDAPETFKVGHDSRSTFPFILSAKSKTSLKANIESMVQFLDLNPETNLADLSYTLCARRMHHSLHVAATASTVAEVQEILKSSLEKLDEVKSVKSGPVSVVLVFTGQGTFYHGIGQQLYHKFPYFREEIEMLDDLSQKMGFPSILSLIDSQDEAQTETLTTRPLLTQLVILLVELALTQFWRLMGLTPNVVVGHSLGEYAALVAAGVLSAADAIYLVGKRAELVEAKCELNSHVMVSVKGNVDTISKIVDSKYTYDVSCINGHENTVISGPKKTLEEVRMQLEAADLRTVQLEVPVAFHSQQLDCMIEEFEKVASLVTFKPPRIPILSPLLQDCLFDGKTINARYLAQASRQTVNFLGALEVAAELEVIDDKTVWLEIGPNPTCSSFIKSWAPSAKVFSSLRRSVDNFATIGSSLTELHCCGVPILWNEYYKLHEKSYSMIGLDSYKWNEKNYWIQYQGTWTLDKAFPTKDSGHLIPGFDANHVSWNTSSCHQVTLETKSKSEVKLLVVSNLKSSSLLSAVQGHQMNGYGVATTVSFYGYFKVQETCTDEFESVYMGRYGAKYWRVSLPPNHQSDRRSPHEYLQHGSTSCAGHLGKLEHCTSHQS